MENDTPPNPPRILFQERKLTAVDRLVRLAMVVLIFALGMVAGFGAFKIQDKKQHPGPFTAEGREDEILIRLRGEPVALLWDEDGHYQFALAGGNSPWNRAFVSGSVTETELAELKWYHPSGNERILRSWAAGEGAVWEGKASADLLWNDKILNKGYRDEKSAPLPKPDAGGVMSMED